MKVKIGSVLLSGLLLLSSSISVFAQTETLKGLNGGTIEHTTEITSVVENEEMTEKSEVMENDGLTSEVSRGSTVPTSKYDWSNGSYSIEADTSIDIWMYTNKYFTDFTDATLAITAYFASGTGGIYPRGDVDVYIYKKEIFKDTLVYTTTVSADTKKTMTLSNYKSDQKYYIKFSGVMNIEGPFSRN